MDYEDVENSDCLHEIIDDDKKGRARVNQSDEAPNPVEEAKDNIDKRVRITQADLIKYGHARGRPRCEDPKASRARTSKHHSEECRVRIYGEYEQEGGDKWDQVCRELRKDYPELVPDTDIVDRPVVNEPKPQRPQGDKNKREPAQAPPANMDVEDVEPGSVYMEPDDEVYRAQAADVFMDDSDDDEDPVRMVESLNQLGADLLGCTDICRQYIQRSRNIC